MERVGVKVQIILSNNFSYTGVILGEDEFFIVIRDKFNEKVSIGKKDIQIIKEVSNNGN
jgi:small nuclear ribonucleoprotein (snRNP)-like protein